jgi:glycosyltransferase involved in cell wall biosynthesis
MAGRIRDTSRLLSVEGVNIPHIGYGKMVQGLKTALSEKVTLDDRAETVMFALRPNLISGWFDDQRVSVLTMWETNWLPPQFHEYIPLIETVIVPSMHNYDLFSQFHNNVHMIPLGVDRDMWCPSADKPEGKFRIMCGGSEWYRKGLDVVLEVFNRLQLSDAELHIKIVPPHLSAPKNLDYPNVIFHREWLTVEQERDLVRSMDGFVSVSRGEGFGLMPLQAISAGIPTILSNAHGHREFADLATHRIPTTSVPTAKGLWQDMGDWDEPDADALAEAITDLYNKRDKYRRQAVLTAPQTAAFNWNTAADQVLQIVQPTTNRSTGAWKPFEPTCEIEVSKRIQATIGQHKVELSPGVKHRVVLNVRDVLLNAGVLK